MSDISIKLNKVNNKKVKCRFFWLKPCKNCDTNGFLPKGTPYVAINGWATGGKTTFCLCIGHAKKFLSQAELVKKEIDNDTTL